MSHLTVTSKRDFSTKISDVWYVFLFMIICQLTSDKINLILKSFNVLFLCQLWMKFVFDEFIFSHGHDGGILELILKLLYDIIALSLEQGHQSLKPGIGLELEKWNGTSFTRDQNCLLISILLYIDMRFKELTNIY